MCFNGFPGGPGAKDPWPGVSNLGSSNTKYSIKPAGIKGYEKTRMQTANIRIVEAAI